MFKFRNFSVFLLLSVFLSCSKKNSTGNEAVTLEDLLVKDNEISGWSLGGGSWQASSITDLTIYIDGAADIFQRHGFVEAVSQDYQGMIEGASAYITVQIFDQTSGEHTASLFPDYKENSGVTAPETWDEAGDDAIIVRYPMSRQIIFIKDRYFVYLDVSSGLETALDILKSFARNVDRKIG